MTKYFFSYSRLDADFVLRLANDLKKEGLNVWLDQLNIPAGVPWDDAIQNALKESECMLVIISNTSIQSAHVLDELSYALSKGKRVIPLMIHDCDVPFRVARLQHIDFTGDYNKAFQHLLATLNTPQDDTQRPEQKMAAPLEHKQKEPAISIPAIERKSYAKPIAIISTVVLLSLLLFFFLTKNKNEMVVANTQPTDSIKAGPGKKDSATPADTGKSVGVAAKDSATSLPARLYVHFLRPEISRIKPVLTELKKRGYVVNANAVITGRAGKEIVVSYYYDIDKPEAEQLLKTLYEIPALPPKGKVRKLEGRARRRHYDVWLTYP